jgi:hypothetical protein
MTDQPDNRIRQGSFAWLPDHVVRSCADILGIDSEGDVYCGYARSVGQISDVDRREIAAVMIARWTKWGELEKMTVTATKTPKNAIMVLAPYKFAGTWVFDDEATGLVKEAFVAGIDKMIDELTRDIPNAAAGFRLLFSATPFPDHQITLEWRREEMGGNWYFAPKLGYEGWLCPALFKYFPAAPAKLYAKAEPIK